jgi:hypothetical protein
MSFLDFFKRNPPPALKALEDMALHELIALNQALGREHDAIKAKRTEIRQRIDALLHAGQSHHADAVVVPGQVIEARSEV